MRCGILVGALSLALNTRADEEKIPTLRANGITYSNVVVTSRTPSQLFIMHKGGMATVKLADCDAETQAHFGFAAGSSTAAEPGKNPTRVGNSDTYVNTTLRRPEIMAMEVKAFAAGFVLVHLLFSWCCYKICKRAGYPSQFLVWCPSLKYLALFKAAGVSRFWFFIPVANAIAWFSVCQRLAETFGQSKLFGVAMFLPGFSFLAFLYLTWASRAEDREPLAQAI